ncbi:MAG TPA: PilT/PilU family type 4a pilus ATPase [Desulfovibrio sp.]|uniref:type IV pilus twitching motility protein PilT n=1 Tax=Desulfovibrio sp. TaxID=885 RepID=UPI002C733987|nr:PilT/PilU family type 4a pilus ATPase [Desulfovibrio sp.]HMM37471.1 PilT/PilU family type 4a pilus ATPase [Desulfovibrio sp.]
MTRQDFDALMARLVAVQPKVSDVIITSGRAVQAEVDGALADVDLGPEFARLTPAQTKLMAAALMDNSARLIKTLGAKGSCDLSYALPGKARFRVNIFSQRGTLAAILRRLPTGIPTMEDLGLPEAFREMAKDKYGLILVTGGTGSGKSNSLAALVDAVNTNQAVHIITLEDPVEFTHRHKKGTVNQRELGVDFDTFASGLRAAFRQAPKVILVGEIRDRETMEIALQAAATGHLVLSTLHTTDCGQTINRIIGLFDPSEERLIRMRLAESLKWVVSQRLLPKAEGHGRVAAFEVMRNTLRVKELILGGETLDKTYYGVLEEGGPHGMNTFDQCFFQLFQKGLVTEETATLSASDRSKLVQMIDKLKTDRGETADELILEGLEDEPPAKG